MVKEHGDDGQKMSHKSRPSLAVQENPRFTWPGWPLKLVFGSLLIYFRAATNATRLYLQLRGLTGESYIIDENQDDFSHLSSNYFSNKQLNVNMPSPPSQTSEPPPPATETSGTLECGKLWIPYGYDTD
jgi:hypothetical protein